MKVKELRPTVVTYCDYCEKEIQPPYHSFVFKDQSRVDLCSSIKHIGEKSCKDRFFEEERFKPKNDKL